MICSGATSSCTLAAVLLLLKVGLRIMRDYDEQIRAGIEQPVFDPAKFADLNIDHRAWALDEPMPLVASAARPAVP